MIVRKLRLEKGLSQEQLAHMAGISTRTLQRIERGSNASAETLKCIASVLETDFQNLREEQMRHSDDRETHSTGSVFADEEREAMEYVRDIKSFYVHAIQYGVVMVALLIVNILTSPDHYWVIWPALGWGIGVIAHGLSVFEFVDLFGDDWEQREIERRLERR